MPSPREAGLRAFSGGGDPAMPGSDGTTSERTTPPGLPIAAAPTPREAGPLTATEEADLRSVIDKSIADDYHYHPLTVKMLLTTLDVVRAALSAAPAPGLPAAEGLRYGPCPTRLDNQPSASARPWRYGHAASIEGAHWDIYAGEGIDGWLVGMVTTEADAALIVSRVNDAALTAADRANPERTE